MGFNEKLSALEDLEELVEILRENPSVSAIVLYGGRRPEDDSAGGDLDLFLFCDDLPSGIESLHFYLNGVPVDLGLRLKEDLEREDPLTFIDHALEEGDVLYDRDGDVTAAIEGLDGRWRRSPQLDRNEIAFQRFSQTHLLDKVRGRTADKPLLSHFLLNTNIYWLVRNYFRLREIPYPGDKPALRHLREEEEEIYGLMRDFYASSDLNAKLSITEELTEAVLAPVGGPWKEDELIVFERAEGGGRIDLRDRGESFLSDLLESGG